MRSSTAHSRSVVVVGASTVVVVVVVLVVVVARADVRSDRSGRGICDSSAKMLCRNLRRAGLNPKNIRRRNFFTGLMAKVIFRAAGVAVFPFLGGMGPGLAF